MRTTWRGVKINSNGMEINSDDMKIHLSDMERNKKDRREITVKPFEIGLSTIHWSELDLILIFILIGSSTSIARGWIYSRRITVEWLGYDKWKKKDILCSRAGCRLLLSLKETATVVLCSAPHQQHKRGSDWNYAGCCRERDGTFTYAAH